MPAAREHAPLLAAAVGVDGININYTEAAGDLDAARLALFDAVIVHGHAGEFSREQSAALRSYLDAGGGLLAIHDGPDSGVLRELIGTVAPADTATMREHGRGRVFYTSLGRDRATWLEPTFQQRIRDAILWAVGDSARALLRAYAVPALTYVEPPVPVPSYGQVPEPVMLQQPLSPEASLKHWQVPPGFELQLFAAEPMIVNPIAIAWDERGRAWVVETVDYPNNIVADGTGNDRILILEDTSNDGRADKTTVFADKLSIPTGMVFANGGVIISNAPRFLFLADTTGDDRADVRREIMTGWSAADTHSGPSNLQYGFDNHIWGSVGDAGFDGVVAGKRLQFGPSIYRFERDGTALEVVALMDNNTWGLGFSESFDVFNSTANNEHSVFTAIPARYYDGVAGLRGSGKVRIDGHYARHALRAHIREVDYFGGFSAAGGHNLYTARSFPQEYWNRVAFVYEPLGSLVHRAVIERNGSGFRESDGWNAIASADQWAAPVHAQVGPDGAVWILDWYSFILQHNPTPPGFQTGAGAAYETPLRDREHGRIYRLVWRGAPSFEPLSLSRDRPGELVAALRHHNMFWRLTAQRLLVERGNTDVLEDVYRIISNRSVDAIGLNAPAIHAIWTLHGLGALDGTNARAERAVFDALRHPAAGVRKNALMALPRNAALFEQITRAGSLADVEPNVRIHALLALADVPASDSIGRALYRYGKDPRLLDDEWLPTALFLAARRHSDGYLAAYTSEIGASEFAQLSGRAARGELDVVVNWSADTLDDTAWQTIRVPAHWRTTALIDYFGVVWFRRELNLPANAAKREATLGLGPISDGDTTYINGVRVGATWNLPGEVRTYHVPAGVLRAGRNIVAIKVTNFRRGRGIYGEPEQVFLAGNGFRIPLAGDWKYRKAAEWRGGREPDFTAGVPFELQFLRIFNPGRARTDSTRDTLRTDTARADVRLTLRPVIGQNRYDRDVITVRAGQRVEITFDNTDAMPHNVVITARGTSMNDIGALLNAYVADASAAGRDFIPPRLAVIAQSRMVGARQTEAFAFTAPSVPGDYPFVCTVPGHWQTMRGVLRVR